MYRFKKFICSLVLVSGVYLAIYVYTTPGVQPIPSIGVGLLFFLVPYLLDS